MEAIDLQDKGIKFGSHVTYREMEGCIFPHPTQVGVFTEESTPNYFSYCKTSHTKYTGAHYREKGGSYSHWRHFKGRPGVTPKCWSGYVIGQDQIQYIEPIVNPHEEIKFFAQHSEEEKALASLSSKRQNRLRDILGPKTEVDYIASQELYKKCNMDSPAYLYWTFITPGKKNGCPILFCIHRSCIPGPKTYAFDEIYAWVPMTIDPQFIKDCTNWSFDLISDIMSFLPPAEHLKFKEVVVQAKGKCYNSISIPSCFQRVLVYETWNREFSIRHRDSKKSERFNQAKEKSDIYLKNRFYNIDILRGYWDNLSEKKIERAIDEMLKPLKSGKKGARDLEELCLKLNVKYESGGVKKKGKKRAPKKRKRKPTVPKPKPRKKRKKEG